MTTRFVSEAIQPDTTSMDMHGLPMGEPGVPMRFAWRGENYVVEKVIRRWKEASNAHGGGKQQYIRKHWFELQITDGSVMKIYFERQARSSGKHPERWWLYTLTQTTHTQ